MSEALTIKPKGTPDQPEYLDFDQLRREGIRHIQELSGALWTDHNVHDPGITILEVLCYALTDLDYRTKLDTRDLLARRPELADTPDDNFFTAAEILGNNPLSIADYRKLLLDLPGVRNAWLEPVAPTANITSDPVGGIPRLRSAWQKPVSKAEADIRIDQPNSQLTFDPGVAQKLSLNGLYKVYLELETDIQKTDECGHPTDQTGTILQAVRERLQSSRNLCEDFLDLVVLRDERIGLCAEIELDPDAFPDEVAVRILDACREYLSPTLPFYTLQQMLDKGKTPDEIFEGRPLGSGSHGFIDPEDLKRLDRRDELHVSDLYRILLQTEGVSAIKKLTLFNYSVSNTQGEDWVLPLRPWVCRPVLAIEESLQGITFLKHGVPFLANGERIKAILEKRLANPNKVPKKPEELDLAVPKGEYRPDLGEYYSIQHDFPVVYGIGAHGLPEDASPKRQAQAAQLKGYLLFYDQLLANYLAQMANLRSLFPTRNTSKGDVPTAFAGSLNSVPQQTKAPLIRNTTTTIDDEYYLKEAIASLTNPSYFRTPQERDFALDQVVAAFDSGSAVIEALETPDQSGYWFVIRIIFGREIVLKSIKTYSTPEEARTAMERVRFMATLPNSYTRIDKPAAKQFGFELTYQPVNYQEYLQEITESPEQHFERKNQLLDHLLSRFAEDFTDYTLLTFALNRKQGRLADTAQFAQHFAHDKANFLAEYPLISRTRGQAFNYSDQPLSSGNISGLERRVKSILGLNTLPTRRLNYFSVAPSRAGYLFEFRDPDQFLLLRSRLEYDTHEEALLAGQALLELAKNPDRYLAEICPLECAHSFKVLNAKGCEQAFHPQTYGSAGQRDALMRYVQGVAQGDGLMHTLRSDTEGWVFRLFDDNEKVLLESVTTVETESLAQQAFLHAIAAAGEVSNFQRLDEPLGRGFSFEIVSKKSVLALHPKFYTLAAERDQVLADVYHFLKDREFSANANQTPTRHRWQLLDEHGSLLLQSLHFFKASKQTAFAFNKAMAAANQKNFRKIPADHGRWTFELLQRQTYHEELPSGRIEIRELLTPIGAPEHTLDSELACDLAIQKVIALAEILHRNIPEAWYAEDFKAGNVWSALSHKNGKGAQEVLPGDFYMELPMPGKQKPVWLKATSRWATKEAAQVSFYFVIQSACMRLFDDFEENDGCSLGFNLLDENGATIAICPARFLSAEERQAAQNALAAWACTHRLQFETPQIETAFQFELWRKNCDDYPEIILQGTEKFKRDDLAEAAFGEAVVRLEFLSDPQSVDLKGYFERNDEAPFRFWLRKEVDEHMERVATSPEEYETAQARDEAINALLNLIRWRKARPLLSVQHNEPCSCNMADGSSLETMPYIWQVSNEEERIGRYHQRYSNQGNAEACALQLARRYVCCLPRLSTVWTQRDNYTGQEPSIFFVLRDRTSWYWRSAQEYSSEEEARRAFDAQYIDILALARQPESYQTYQHRDGYWLIRLHQPDGQLVAEACRRLSEATDAIAEIDRLIDHARYFPLVRQGEGFGFRLFETEQGEYTWESRLSFPTPVAAEQGLQRFLDLLPHSGHYQAVKEGCEWRLELVESLLESELFNTAPKDASTGNPDEAWKQVEHFLDIYARLDDAVFADYTDHHHCCGYGFRLVGEGYRLARLTTSFYQICDREIARDMLYQAAHCAALAPPAVNNDLLNWLLKVDLSPDDRYFNRRLAIAKALRSADSYVVFKGKTITQNVVYRLGLLDTAGSPLLGFEPDPLAKIYPNAGFFQAFESEEAAVQGIFSHLVAANQLPVLADDAGSKFHFEHRVQQGLESQPVNGLLTDDCEVKTFMLPVFTTEWVSVESFNSLSDAWGRYLRFRQLLDNKNAYYRCEAADGSPTLMIVDPDLVLANHPRTYVTRALRAAAKQRVADCINTEGLHLLEHLLLRPRYTPPPEQQAEGPALLKIYVDPLPAPPSIDDQDFDDYIPGADPYSFITTIILPYWPRRFRDNDFRTFFENTLRRESPAHILPKILWIRPQQMRDFEKYYLCWLERVGDDHCAKPLIEALESLINVFIEAYPLDCADGGTNQNVIILDKTFIN